MSQEKLTLLENYIKSGISPILLDDIPTSVFENAVVLESTCDLSQLNGHYEEMEFCPPEWYVKLTAQNSRPILVISNINKISLDEQTKFTEILKYKKVSTFDLPKNCIIFVTCNNLKENKINEEIYSLMVHI